MKKYSIEWKEREMRKTGGWAQKDGDTWRWHYIKFGTEYHQPTRFETEKGCRAAYGC